MKHLSTIMISALSLILSAAGLDAQQHNDALSAFAARMLSSRAAFDYSFTIDDGRVKMNGSGNVIVQGSSYYMAGNGLEIWCDGTSRWTSDVAAREAVIESVDGNQAVIANPAMLVGNLDREFSWSGNGEAGMFNSKPAKVFTLEAVENAEIGDAVIYMDKAGETITGAEISLPDGSKMTFVISSFRFSNPGPLSDFSPAEFSGGWIVTDLR
ncbi:MAG: outer membrane lipoprotein carrier protein LolA [Bacteroidales bacterium]|nr:outer membrane lipoprotein carrier protein LolA [Bacteroidales bacterium]